MDRHPRADRDHPDHGREHGNNHEREHDDQTRPRSGTRPGSSRSSARFLCLQLGTGEFRWRLIVGNGRCLGRSAESFTEVRDVLDSISHLHRAARHASVTITHPAGGVGWSLRLGDVALAESEHPYGRVVEAIRAADRFVEESPHALLDPTVAVSRTRSSQSRRRP